MHNLIFTTLILNLKFIRLELEFSFRLHRIIDLQYGHGRLIADFSRTIELGFAANCIEEIFEMRLMWRFFQYDRNVISYWRR